MLRFYTHGVEREQSGVHCNRKVRTTDLALGSMWVGNLTVLLGNVGKAQLLECDTRLNVSAATRENVL